MARRVFSLEQVLDEILHDSDSGDEDFDPDDTELVEIHPNDVNDPDFEAYTSDEEEDHVLQAGAGRHIFLFGKMYSRVVKLCVSYSGVCVCAHVCVCVCVSE